VAATRIRTQGGNDMSDASDDPENVEEGIAFGDLDQRLEAHGFPIEHDEFLSEFGDFELELTSGDDVTIREVMEPLQGGDTYRDVDAVHQTILNFMPEEAVGRKGYSDRGGDSPTETEAAERVDEIDSEDARNQGGSRNESDDRGGEDESF